MRWSEFYDRLAVPVSLIAVLAFAGGFVTAVSVNQCPESQEIATDPVTEISTAEMLSSLLQKELENGL